jgi:DHA2 family multidrug resistance protein-like MFS transporter
VAISTGIFVGLSSVDAPGSVLDKVIRFEGRQDNVAIRQAAMMALFFNLLMVIVAIIAIMKTIPESKGK